MKFFKNLYLFPFSIILWSFWWLIAVSVISLMIFISFLVPKRFYNILTHIACKILMYSVLLIPKHEGILPKNLPYPVIFVANHVSFFDLFISGSVLPGYPRGLELESHFNKPIYGWFIKRFGQIPIALGNKSSLRDSFSVISNILNTKERNIFIMPEGHRTLTGKLSDFKSGAFSLSKRNGVPIVPVVYKNLFERNNKNSFIISPGFFKVIILPPVYPEKFESYDDMSEYIKDIMSKELENK